VSNATRALILALALITAVTVLAALGVIDGQTVTRLLESLGAGTLGGAGVHALKNPPS
jgi:hypothetical protein